MAPWNRRPFTANIWSTSPITKVCVDRDKMKRVAAVEGGEIWTEEERRELQPI